MNTLKRYMKKSGVSLMRKIFNKIKNKIKLRKIRKDIKGKGFIY